MKSKRWHEARALLKRRTVCQICHRRKSEQIDHIVPHSQGGKDEPSNWQVACVPCHDRKSKREQMAWLRTPAGRAVCVKAGRISGKIIGDRKAAAARERWGTSNRKKQRRLWYAEWYAKNAERVREYMRRWHAANPDYMRQWRAANPHYGRERYRKQQARKGHLVKRQRRSDPKFTQEKRR